DGEQPRIDARVQGLHAPVEHLGKARVLLDRSRADAGLLELAGGATGGDDLCAELVERAREVDHAALVENREEGALDLELAELGGGAQRGGRPTVAHRICLWSFPGRARPRAPAGGCA